MNVFGLTAKYFIAVFDLTLYTPNLNADVRKIYYPIFTAFHFEGIQLHPDGQRRPCIYPRRWPSYHGGRARRLWRCRNLRLGPHHAQQNRLGLRWMPRDRRWDYAVSNLLGQVKHARDYPTGVFKPKTHMGITYALHDRERSQLPNNASRSRQPAPSFGSSFGTLLHTHTHTHSHPHTHIYIYYC